MTNAKIRMWLDDLRDPTRFGYFDWIWVKTADEAIELLKTGNVIEASLDHDLTQFQTIGQVCHEKTGYSVVCWMEENNVWPINGTRVHSQNPVGRAKMQQIINRAYQN